MSEDCDLQHGGILRFLTPLTVAAVLSACQSGPKLERPNADDFKVASHPADTRDSRDIPISAGEVLDVYVLEDSSLNGQYTVRTEGHIIFPGMGRVVVGGLTPSAAEARLKQLLEASKLRTATVLLDRVVAHPSPLAATTDQLLVYITGKVVRPGQHSLTIDRGGVMGAYEAILVTGGLARFANESKAYILREASPGQPKRKIAVDLKAVSEGTAQDVPLRAGDVVYVPEKVFGF